MQFSELIGQTVLLIIPKMHPVKLQKVKVLGVEAGGLWLESQEVTNILLETAGAPSAPRTLAIFLPWHQISEGAHSVDGPSLNEKAFGV
jgi:hypothetical protein